MGAKHCELLSNKCSHFHKLIMWPGCVYRRLADGAKCRTDGEIIPTILPCIKKGSSHS